MTKPLCIYHGNCADGFTAAWAVWKRFGDGFDYFAATHGAPPPDVEGRDVVIVDFAYRRDVTEEMAKSARSMLILDHHKTAQADLEGYLEPIRPNDIDAHMDEVSGFAGSARKPQTPRVVFDMERSGAGIAWDFFHPGEARPALVNYVEDRDLWRFKLPGSRNINAVVFSYPYEFEEWDELAKFIEHAQPEAERAGGAIERKHHKDVVELVKAFRRDMVIGGYRVPVANVPYTLVSDAAHLMCAEYNGDFEQNGVTAAMPPFAACYWDTPAGRVFGLRSVGDFDVSEIAKKYGGGGHKNAAGFTIPHGATT